MSQTDSHSNIIVSSGLPKSVHEAFDIPFIVFNHGNLDEEDTETYTYGDSTNEDTTYDPNEY